MTELKSNYQRTSVKASALCATFGLLAGSLIAAILWGVAGVGLHQIIIHPAFRLPIVIGVIALFAAAISFGLVGGNLIYRFGLQSYATPLIGIALAWLCLLISAVSGASVSFINEINDDHAFTDYIARPVIGIVVVGLLPAFILGLVYSAIVRTALSET